MINQFDKIYNNIILQEANTQNSKWVQISTYKGVNKFYSKDHVDQRYKERYEDDIEPTMINRLINRFIDKLIQKNAWKGTKEISFSFYAQKSNIWFSGQFQRNIKTNKKELCIATVLPSKNSDPHPFDLILKLDI